MAFLFALAASVAYIVFHVAKDLDSVSITSYAPYAMLALALLIALGFEFVNGFHDTANAVATVFILTHWNRILQWSGRASATCAECFFLPEQWLSRSSRFCRWS